MPGTWTKSKLYDETFLFDESEREGERVKIYERNIFQ